jgi:oxygen-independent coproporphyrinogen-3 oxidase
MVRDFTREARALGFASINFDLIYGLPAQTEATMSATIDRALELSPDRIAFYRLAVIPEIFKWQRGFSRHDLPKGKASLGLMILAVNRFTDAGYRFIGLDHFAKPDEGLAKALDSGEAQRNFQGMTTQRGLVNLAVGPSAITSGPSFFAQNVKSSKDWKTRVAESGFATERGMTLGADDLLRSEMMQEIYGYAAVDFAAFGKRHGIDAESYFARERGALVDLEKEGFVELTKTGFRATDMGRLLLRVIAAAFDAYLPADAWRTGIAPTQASSAG